MKPDNSLDEGLRWMRDQHAPTENASVSLFTERH